MNVLLTYLMIWQRKEEIYCPRNHKYKETDSINSEVSTFVGNSVFQDL